MTIEESKCNLSHAIRWKDRPTDESMMLAIATMCKYQRIEQILHNGFGKGVYAVFEEIIKEMQDWTPIGSTYNPFFTVSGVNELAKYSIETIGHSDPYLQGMCNGIEYMRGVLTDTEPHFFTEVESEDKE